MDERGIRIIAVIGEKDRQLNAALAEICNLRAEVAVRDARIGEANQKSDELQKQVEDLLGQMADKVLAPKTKKVRANG